VKVDASCDRAPLPPVEKVGRCRSERRPASICDMPVERGKVTESAPRATCDRGVGTVSLGHRKPVLHHDDARDALQAAFDRDALVVRAVEELVEYRRDFLHVEDWLLLGGLR